MKQKIEKILKTVEKPLRYCGGEYNIPKQKDNPDFKFLMCFPDLYEVAMSNLGIKILYHLLNDQPNIRCERCFAPAPDLFGALKSEGLPLFSLETQTPAHQFDMIGFSLQYELSYSTVLYMLDSMQLPFLGAEREEQHPLIIGGGPCAVNPTPLNKIFDLFVIGDGEEAILQLSELFVKNKAKGGKRSDFLAAASSIEGVYVPSHCQGKVKKALVKNLDSAYYPLAPIVPTLETVHDRAVLEVFRGCTRGCRFCQAGFIYRPIRERSASVLQSYAKTIIKNTGYDEMSLSSLSICDYSQLRELSANLSDYAKQNKISISLPSLRLDSFDAEFTEDSRLSSVTFAPEAGTQRLRDIINKNITEQNIITALTAAFERGYNKVKLYFMLGLPQETDDDVQGIIDLARKIKSLYREKGSRSKGGLALTVSTSTFIPKPFTPFEREASAPEQTIVNRRNILRNSLKKMGVKYNWHDYDSTRLETIFARGDQRLNEVLISAYKKGAFLDGWSEHFKPQCYYEALCECGLNAYDFQRQYAPDEGLPWDFVDLGISPSYLAKEAQRAREGQTTPDCRASCLGCGEFENCKGIKKP